MFKLIAQLAIKNAFLRQSRTLLLVIMIAISMGLMVCLQGFYDGMALKMIEKNTRIDSGEISLYRPNYLLDRNIKNSITNADVIIKNLKSNVKVKQLVSRISVTGLATTARKSATADIIGINLEDEEAFGQFSAFMKKGELNLDKRNTIIGSELAKILKVKLGSKVIFSSQDKNTEIASVALKIRGIIQSSNINIDQKGLFVNKKTIAKLLAIKDSSATQIAIRTDDSALINELRSDYPNQEVKSFIQLYPMIKQMKDMMTVFNSITFFIVVLVVFIGILGVMYVSVLDRIREFGILRAIGMQYKLIRWQIVGEAAIVGLVGFIAGAILGFIGLSYFQSQGLNLSSYAESLESFGLDTVIYATIKSAYFINTFLAIMLASVLSVFLPLRTIKKMHAIEVIKSNT